MADQSKFLDYPGLSRFYNNLKGRYATKNDLKNIDADTITTTALTVSGYANIEQLVVPHLYSNDQHTEYIDAAKADITYATITNLTATNEAVSNLTARTVTVEGNLTAAQADITDLKAADVNITGRLDAAEGNITTLTADNATINQKLTAAEADITSLTADYATINGKLTAAVGDISYIQSNYAKSDISNVNTSWITNGIIKNGAITDAMIGSLSANKLTAGTINGSVINVTNLNADNITAGTLNGQRIGEGTLSLDKLSEDVYTESEVDAKLSTMQAEIDGAIETYTGTDIPTLNNTPASSWTTNDEKAKHVGDVYYVVNAGNQADGYCYRFANTGTTANPSYGWILIKDSDVTAALQRLIDAEGDIDGLQSFESTTSSWITETDEELSSLKTNHTSLVAVVDKTLVSTTQLWFTKANTTVPNKPTTHVTSTSTAGNAWRTVVPAYNSSYPNYFYCYEWKYADGTYGWSDVTRDIGMGETQSTARTASSNASTALTNAATAQSAAEGAQSTANTAVSNAETAQNTANANIKSTVQLWFTKADTTAPSKPTAHVTTNDASTANAWNIAVPTYNATYPNYFYCYEYQKGDDTYSWSDVVLDRATTENQANARSALSQVATKVETSTFNEVKQTVDTNSASITTLSETVETKANSDDVYTKTKTDELLNDKAAVSTVTTLSTTVNDVQQTATSNSSKISNLTTRLGTNADGTQTSTDIVSKYSDLSQSLDTFKSTVSSTYATQANLNAEINQRKAMYGTSSTAAGTTAKVVTCANFVLYTGARVAVTFSNANTATVPTLNVNSTGAKTIKSFSGADLTEAEYKWAAGSTLEFIYDGTNWRLADEGTLKRLNAAEGTLSIHTTSIEQNTNAIALKANAADVYTKTQTDGLITTEVNNRNAAITASADAINLSVSQTYTTKTEFENLEIGGKNLLTYSDSQKLYLWSTAGNNGGTMTQESNITVDDWGTTTAYRAYGNAGSTSELFGLIYQIWGASQRSISGQDYVFSIYIKNQSTNALVVAINGIGNSKRIPAGETTRVICNGTGNGSKVLQFTFLASAASGTYDFIYWRPQIELGNKVTDWSPAPEDLEAYTDSAVSAAKTEIKQTTDNISLEVSKKVGSSEIISKINQSAETVKIQASKVEIDGAAVFTAIKSSADAAYDAKGAAASAQTAAINSANSTTDQKLTNYSTTTQMNTAISNAVDNIEVGGRNWYGYGSDLQTSLSGLNNYGNGFSIVTEDGYKCAHVSGALNTTKYLQSRVNFKPNPLETFTFSGYVKIKNIVRGTTNPMCEFYFSGATLDGGWKGFTVDTIYVDGTKVGAIAIGFDRYITDTNWHHVAVTAHFNYSGTTAIPSLNANIYLRDCTGDLYIHHVKFEKGNKATDWSPTPEDLNVQEQRIYYKTTSTTAPTAPTTWVAETGTVALAWTTKRMPYDQTNKYLYTCTQRQAVGGGITNSTVLLDDTTTVIDGGNIIAGTVTANKLNASDINASKTLTVGALTDATQSQVLNSEIEVGGRNLLGETANKTSPTSSVSSANNTFGSIAGYNTSPSDISIEEYDDSSYALTATETATGNRGVGWYTKPGVLAYGDTVTFSCRVKASLSTSVHTHTAWRNASATAIYTGWTAGGSKTIEADTWTDYSYTFTCASAYPDGEFHVALCFTGKSSGLTWKIAHAKLEKGNKPTDWTPAPEDVDSDISDASKTATSYIVANSTGLMVANMIGSEGQLTPSGITSGYNTLITPTSFNVRDGQTVLASFGNAVTIGGKYLHNGSYINSSYVSIDYHSLQMIDKEGNSYFHISDLRDGSGSTEVTDVFYGDGRETEFRLSIYASSTNYTVTVTDDTSGATVSTKETTRIIFNTAPDDGATITVAYTTDSIYAKAFTIGKRASGTIGCYSVALGRDVKASGFNSISEGYDTTASGWSSHAEGRSTTASGDYAHAEGSGTTASETSSHAEGWNTTARWVYSHAEGTNTTASGTASHAEGSGCTASGTGSHAEGVNTEASGFGSHAQNYGTIASYGEATAIGRYNTDGNYALMIGNGTSSSARSNAFTVDWSGNVIASSSVRSGTLIAGYNNGRRLYLQTDSNVGAIHLYDSTPTLKNSLYIYDTDVRTSNFRATSMLYGQNLSIGDNSARHLVVGGGSSYVWMDSRDSSNNVKISLGMYDDCIYSNRRIHAASEIRSNATLSDGGNFRAISGNYGTILRNDSSNFYILLTDSGNATGSWNDLRPLFINLSTGAVSSASNWDVYSSANKTFNVRSTGGTADLNITTASSREARVTVNNGVHAGKLQSSSGNNFGLYDNTNSKWVVYSNSSGTVTVNTSDRRAKNYIQDTTQDSAIDLLRSIKIRQFTYKDDEHGVVTNGIFAQDIRDYLISNNMGYRSYLNIQGANGDEEIYYDLTMDEDKVQYGLEYHKLVPELWLGWQYHDDEITTLKAENERLRKRIEMVELLLVKNNITFD